MRWIAIAMVFAGCGKSTDPGPSCAQVVDHMLEVTKQTLVGHDNMVLGPRDAMIAQCDKRQMPADKRACLMAAKTTAEIGACRANSDPAENQRRRSPVAPTAPAATDRKTAAEQAGSGWTH